MQWCTRFMKVPVLWDLFTSDVYLLTGSSVLSILQTQDANTIMKIATGLQVS